MPFIDIWVFKYEGMDIPSYEFSDLVKNSYTDTQESKPVAGLNCTGYQVTYPFDNNNTISETYFIKNDTMVLIWFIARNDKYISYVGAYNHVVKNLALMGQ